MDTAPTETTSSSSAGNGAVSRRGRLSSRRTRRNARPLRRRGANGSRCPTGRPDDPSGGAERWNGAVKARGAIDAFLDAELKRLSLDNSRLVLVGFSQGTMMALHVGLRRPRAPAAIIGYSGLLVGPEHLAEATARDARGAPPPILLIHGDQDALIPFEAMLLAAEALAVASIPVQWHLSLGIGHGIDGGGLRHGGLFLAQALASRGR